MLLGSWPWQWSSQERRGKERKRSGAATPALPSRRLGHGRPDALNVCQGADVGNAHEVHLRRPCPTVTGSRRPIQRRP